MESYVLTLVFFTVAYLCLAVELLILPGFGVVGVVGLLLLGGAIIYAWLTLGTGWGVGLLLLSLLSLIVGAWLISRTRFGKRFVLSTSQKGTVSAIGADFSDLVGKVGIATSDLRPVGSAIFDGKKVDVVAKGVFIKKDTKVRVVETNGPSIVVVQEMG